MNINFTQKETALLQEQKSHEELCVKKYSAYANQAQDAQLQQLFNTHASHEQQHLDTINQLLSGQLPNINQQQGQQAQQGMQGQQSLLADQGQQMMQSQQYQQNMQGQQYQQFSTQSTQQSFIQDDASLCTDMLMTEKYISGVYDTAIFEFADTNVRQVLNHIQKEEQQHGLDLYNYLNSHGMYN